MIPSTIRNVVVVLGLGSVLISSAWTLGAAEIVVQADTVVEVNGQSTIPDGLFGITDYGGGDHAAYPSLHAVFKNSGIRWVGMRGSAWPKEAPADFRYGWADTPAAGALLDKKMSYQHTTKAMRGWLDLGVEPMIYGSFRRIWPDSGDGKEKPKWPSVGLPITPLDLERAGLEQGEHIAWLRRVHPGLTWVHFENEPNVYWFKLNKGEMGYAKIFKEVAKAVHKRNPGIKIGGTVNCWPPSFPPNQKGIGAWGDWGGWTMPLIKTAGDELDFFDFHLYDSTCPLLGLEEVQTVVNAMWLEGGKRKPVIISEYGTYIPKDEDARSAELVWDRRVKPWQSQVMDFLDIQPDKVMSLQPHDLWSGAGGNFQFIKNSTDINDQYPLYKTYHVWSAFSGTRLLATSADPTVRVFASSKVSALTGQASLVLILVNTSNASTSVSLRLAGGARLDESIPSKESFVRLVGFSGSAEALKRESDAKEGIQDTAAGGAVGGGVGQTPPPADQPVKAPAPGSDAKAKVDYSRFENESVESKKPVFTVTLAPRETRSHTYALSQPLTPVKKRWTRDVFGDVVHKDFGKDGDSINVTFVMPPATAAGADQAEVRVGLGGFRPNDKVVMTVDGVEYPLLQDWFQSVRLKTVPPPGKLEVVFKLLKRGTPKSDDHYDVYPLLLRFMSATIAFQGGSEYNPDAPVVLDEKAPAISQWNLKNIKSILSRMENPWGRLGQSVPGSALDQFNLDKGIPDSVKLKCGQACESLTFRAPVNGTYRLAVSGKLTGRTNPSAGSALVTVYILGHVKEGMREIKSFPLNTTGGAGGHPQEFSWSGILPLQAGWRFAVGIQTRNGGPADAGTSEIELTEFNVELLRKDQP
jgi:hypothetical protein